VNHECDVNVMTLGKLGAAAVGLVSGVVDCVAGDAGCVSKVLNAAGSVVTAAGGNFLACGAPKVFRSGGVIPLEATSSTPVQTLLLDPSGNSFTVQAASGWLTQSDGDMGNSLNFGFYHQELTATGGGVTDLAVSDRFRLPRGTACGFHHTMNTPYNILAGPQSTCMGQDPAYGQCPNGWTARSHFDMSSGHGAFVWCEYEDQNNLCTNDPSCLATARANGYTFGISSDADSNGTEWNAPPVLSTPAQPGDVSCPEGFSRTAFFDDGRGAGWGLSWCWPIADLPQGLTAGAAYVYGNYPNQVSGDPALGSTTAYGGGSAGANADGYRVRSDGDYGAPGGYGFYHQELVSGGVTEPWRSQSFALLPGTACGFHHTINTPGLTCMGSDPASGTCPDGWRARSQFDMSSGHGYYAWCEYLDPQNLCGGYNATDCFARAAYIGYAVGFSSDTDANGVELSSNRQCPAAGSPNQWKRSPYFDRGRGSGQGLSWCMP
jgi:hypothetical protein